ncbi:MAG: chromate transporter [Clostridia bacterium]|nr:chromate transporter [Oscillospiraceae bacterium]MBQ7960897.1 chromate transporter [Clostridia bacterium]
MPLFLTMFIEFFKVGLFSVGGGLATLPFLFEIAEKYGWFTAEELTNMIAVSESSPGPIGVNMATYVGFTTGNAMYGIIGGIMGGIITTIALITPSVIVILIISVILEKFKENKFVKYTFYGLRAAVAGLLALSVLSVFGQNFLVADAAQIWEMVDYRKAVLFAVLVFMVFKLKKHPILYIGIGAAAGILFNFGG